MKKLSSVIDTFLTLAALFLLAVFVVGYFSSDRYTILFFAVVFAFAGAYFTTRISRKRSVPKIRKRKLDALMNKFVFSPPEYARDYVRNALAAKGEVAEVRDLLVVGKTAFAVQLTAEKVSAVTLALSYASARECGAEKLVILSAKGATEDADETAKLLSSPKAEIWDFEKTYRLLAYLGHPPRETLELAPEKKKKGALFAGALSKHNARKYLMSAIVTLVFARFMPHAVLYVIFSALGVTLAILCKLNVAERLRKRT